jgi:hypothetical protein
MFFRNGEIRMLQIAKEFVMVVFEYFRFFRRILGHLQNGFNPCIRALGGVNKKSPGTLNITKIDMKTGIVLKKNIRRGTEHF